MKRKTAKEILAESFREVAEHKSIDKISVKDITENCGYSPATFYRQFSDKYDLIAWDYTRELEGILTGLNGRKAEWHSALQRAASFFEERKTYLANLFRHTSGLESFINNMQDINYQCLKEAAEKTLGSQSVDALTEKYIRVYVLGTAQFTCEWILGRIDSTAEELATVYEQTLPVALQKYMS